MVGAIYAPRSSRVRQVCAERAVADLSKARKARRSVRITGVKKERETGLEPATFSLEG